LTASLLWKDENNTAFIITTVTITITIRFTYCHYRKTIAAEIAAGVDVREVFYSLDVQ